MRQSFIRQSFSVRFVQAACAAIVCCGAGRLHRLYRQHVGRAGGTGFVDVLLTTNDAADDLTEFTAEFRIAPQGGAPLPGGRTLSFANPQSETFFADPNYVFAGQSLSAGGPFPVGTVSPSTVYSFLDVATGAGLTGPFTRLLARLNVTTLAAAPLAGDVFTIDVVPANTTVFDPLAEIPHTSAPGTVTITPAAVPEPSSLLLLLLLLLLSLVAAGGGVTAWRKPRRAAA